MSLTITFDLPPEVEQILRAQTPNLDAAAKEAFAVELYRRGKLNQSRLPFRSMPTGY